jgi:D-glycero-D-manno-heptose 1,7-bisphosphate phosphatase
MGIYKVNKAVFLDRDGIINELILNPQTEEYESPLSENDLEISPEVFSSLKSLQEAGFLLFVVSNQPNYAKGKVALEVLHKINQRLAQLMLDNEVQFTEYFYCYHHPKGVVKDYSGECQCRKPKPYYLIEAQRKYNINLGPSWFVGDQDCDVQCGQAAGVKTILVNERHSKKKRGNSTPDYHVNNLVEAVEIMLKI